MPVFEEYIDTIRPLIVGHCCPEHELYRTFHIYDQNRNGVIELREFYRLIDIIGRSTTEEKSSNFIERVNMVDDRSLNYEQFKQFVRLGYGREMLINISMEE
jgi:Ca2+-binding EF-hand superfamily protein